MKLEIRVNKNYWEDMDILPMILDKASEFYVISGDEMFKNPNNLEDLCAAIANDMENISCESDVVADMVAVIELNIDTIIKMWDNARKL